MKSAVHQLLAVFDPADAQGVMALRIREILREAGIDSEIYAATALRAPGRPRQQLPSLSARDTLIYHYSIGSPAAGVFRRTRARRVLVYHNVTPEKFFRGFDDLAMLACRRGRRELAGLAASVELALPVSEFNAADLREAGFKRIEVLPFPLVESSVRGPADPEILSLAAGGPVVLFVGRLVPNKRQDLLIRVFQAYRGLFAPEAKLFLAGAAPIASYARRLRAQAESGGSQGIFLLGKTSPAALRALYRCAGLFLCLSEHEGFCVPLLESLQASVPILAYAAGAVPETLGGAGILVERRDPQELAVLIARILSDQNLRARLLTGQSRRLAELRSFPFPSRLLSLLDETKNAVHF